MSTYHLGINLGHDRAAGLVCNGEIAVAIHQERLDRSKHSLGILHQSPGDPSQVQLPDEAIRYCLDCVGITLADVGSITANMPGNDYAPDILRRKLSPEFAGRVHQVPSHHLAHAYSAYWPSGFDQALVLVIDASGSATPNGQTESYTLYEGHGTKLKAIHSHKVPAHLATLSTLGFVYEYVSRKAGFTTKVGSTVSIPEAGKLMGLAPYGGRQHHWNRWFRVNDNRLDVEISAYDIFLEIAALEKRYDDGQGKPYLRPYLVDLAWKVQNELEESLRHIVGHAVRKTGLRKLCLAGGVALNSVANYRLLHDLDLEDIFIFPAAGDAGTAVGCALWAYATCEKGSRRSRLRRATLGKPYGAEDIAQALDKFDTRIEAEKLSAEQLIRRTAETLARGHIVARFEGGSEYGPRALGHRSIMADPTFSRMKDILNARVKFREAFRPFAPVIPQHNISEVFEQQIASPFMLLVSPIKPEYHSKLPAITHYDGTGRVQTVTEDDNPFFDSVCRRLTDVRGGPPVLLNTSFNIAGQPIVETPAEAIETFLTTDIDYLCLEDYWLSKPDVPVKTYEEHVTQLGDGNLPRGLPPGQPRTMDLMRQLDRALFWGETDECPWTPDELSALSTQGARYKETSVLFPDSPLGQGIRTQLSAKTVLILDPLGKSRLIDLGGLTKPSEFSFDEVKLLMAVLSDTPTRLHSLRIEQQCSTLEWQARVTWAVQQLAAYGLAPSLPLGQPVAPDCASPSTASGFLGGRRKHNIYALSPASGMPSIADTQMPASAAVTFAAFGDDTFHAYATLSQLREVLAKSGYTEPAICSLMDIPSLQRVEPTYLHYCDRFRLPHNDLGDLIRLLFLRVAFDADRLHKLLGEGCFEGLVELGMLAHFRGGWVSQVQVYCVDGLYVASDHRFMVRREDLLDEDPVMYIGLDSMGLVNVAPRVPCERILDLCTGSGVQALVASRYAHQVVGVDLNPRAVRFARFNARLNGIENASFLQGDLFNPVAGQTFDAILANPPFVASPDTSLRFRDGGANGENIVSRIVTGAAAALKPCGKLHIVADLLDVNTYRAKLNQWWRGGPAHKLVLQTADRDEAGFSIPHCHVPFEQSYHEYKEALERWVNNLRANGIKAINFGYILIHCITDSNESSFFQRTIANPDVPIHQEVNRYFLQRALAAHPDLPQFFLQLAENIHFKMEYGMEKPPMQVEVSFPGNPYHTTYIISETLLRMIRSIGYARPQWKDFVNSSNRLAVLDLINKGIVRLTAGRRSQEKIPDRRRWPVREDTDPYLIRDLETETTPTCLSSYL